MLEWKDWTPLVAVVASSVVSLVAIMKTNAQNRWQRGFAQAQHELEVRQYRLSLLDRRIIVIKAVTAVAARYDLPSAGMDRERADLFSCLAEGECLFDPAIANRLVDAWRSQIDFHNDRIVAGLNVEETPYVKAKRLALFTAVEKLRDDMVLETRLAAPVQL